MQPSFLSLSNDKLNAICPGEQLSSMEPNMILLGKYAQADNMVAGSILGLTDSVMRKCRNASAVYISGKP